MTTNPIKYSDLIAPDNSIEKLIQQLTQLQATYTQTAETIKSEALQVVASLKGVSGATEQGRKTTQQAATDADRLAQAQRKLEQAESDTAVKIASLKEATREANNISKLRAKLLESEAGSYNRLSAQYSLNKIKINQMSEAERQRNKQLIEDTKRIYQQMDAMQRDTGKFQLNVGNYQNSILGALGMNNQFGQSLLALGKGGGEGRAAMEAFGNSIKALGATLSSLLANPAFWAILGGAAIGAGVKALYDYNAGLQEATKLTMEFAKVSGEEMVEIRSQVTGIADAFGKDWKEVLQTADALAANFGIDFNRALQLIKDGFVAGADVNGDFLNKLRQYPAYFKEAGLGASEFIAIVTQTRSGIFGDQGLDAIKQANARIRQMTKQTADALQSIGIDAKQVEKDLLNGTKSTFDVLQEVSQKLRELPDSSKQVGEVLINVFGKQGRDAGLAMIRALADIDTNLENVKNETGELGQMQEEVADAQIRLEKAMADAFDLTGGTFERIITDLKVMTLDWLTDFLHTIAAVKQAAQDAYNWTKSLFGSGSTGDKGMSRGGGSNGSLVVVRDERGNVVSATRTDAAGKTKDVTKEMQGNAAASALVGGGTTKKGTSRTTDIYKKQLDARRKYEDALLALETDEWEKRRKQTETKYARQIEDLRHTLDTDKSLTVQMRTDINNTILVLEQQQTQALIKLENERQIAQLNIQKQSISLRLQAVKKGSEEEYNLKLQEIELERQIALKQGKGNADDVNAASNAKAAALADAQLKAQLQMFDLQQDLDASEFDLLKNSEQRKTAFRLQQEKARLQKILELNEQASEKMSDAEAQTIQNTISKIDQELGENAKPRDIYELFGLNLDEDKKQAISDSFSFATDQLNSYIDSWVQAADAKVELANKEVESAQKALDAEKQARANGYANEVETAQKELDLAKKNQEKALKEQQKAQKAQELVNTIQQASNLVSASALIWAQLGFPWAIPAIAVMWGSFAAAKIKAAQVTKESYGEGTVELLEGGSHQSGNDIDLGTKADGTRRRAEGGEFFAVINKRNSRKFRRVIPDVIRSLNDGSFTTKYMGAYDGASLVFNVQNKDLKGLSEDVREIRERAQHKTYVDASGKTVIQYKNLKRRVG